MRARRWLAARLGCHSRQWAQRSPFPFLRGGVSALPSLQLCWGVWPSYGGRRRGPTFLRQGWTGAAWPGVPLLFAFQCQAFYLGLLPLSLKINSSLCCCEEVPNTILPHPQEFSRFLGLTSHTLGPGSLAALPTARPLLCEARCLVFLRRFCFYFPSVFSVTLATECSDPAS